MSTRPGGVRLPAERGGWWHAYVCPAHGVELEHTGLTSGTFPAGGAPCRYGCRVDTPAVRGAWTVLAHQACARRIRELARSPSASDRSIAAELLAEYVKLYAAAGGPHDGAASWMLRGRLFHQALTEAIWAVPIGDAARALDEPELPAALAAGASAARAELVAKGRFTSNYTAWLNAAGAACTGDPAWLDGQHGVFEHVLAATGDDGWEWEASSYYHAFVLRAYLLALRGVGDDAVPPPVLDRLRAMAGVLDVVATPGGLLPALHDAPYARPATGQEHAELRALLADRGWTPHREADPSRALACLQVPPTPSWRYLQYNQRGDDEGLDPGRVVVFARAGYAVLRGSRVHAIVDFGPHGGSHGHRDKLALYMYGRHTPWQPDPGQVPYGHDGWRAYFASTAAHPAFSVDGAEQAECAGRLVDAGDRSVIVEVADAYPGVLARRRLALPDGGSVQGGLVDELTVTADRPRRVTLHLRPGVPLQLRTDGVGARTTWSGAERLHGEHTCDDDTAVLLARPGPGQADDPQRTRTHVDWTIPATTGVTFRSIYRAAEPVEVE